MFSFLNRTKPNPQPAAAATTAVAGTAAAAVASENQVNGTAATNGSSSAPAAKEPTGGVELNGVDAKKTSAQIEAHLNEIRKNLLEAILLKRTDIVVSLINEWFKGDSQRRTRRTESI